MDLPRNIQSELEKRDEHILALEMMTVDQACRLLALEAVVIGANAATGASADAINAHIEAQTARFQERFEGTGLTGFIDRAKRIAAELTASGDRA